jgi:uncharacterized protein (DUF362 family)
MDKILYWVESFLKQQISRAKFLKVCLGGILYFLAQNQFLKKAFGQTSESTGRVKKNIKGKRDLVLVDGQDPYQNTIQAIKAMGGMELFVKKGSVVVVKPNMAWDRSPEQAANTNPEVVAALVDLCYQAGAKKVKVFDVPCNDDRRVYERSGISEVAKKHGADVFFANHWNVVAARFPYPSPLEGWPILRDAVVCDTLINVPVLKHHGLTGLTLSMKNLMGVCSGKRGLIHVDIGRKLVDLMDFMSPELTVIDATRVLLRNGPSGGNLADVAVFNKLIVATDPTLADAYASKLLNIDPMKIPYLAEATQRKKGNMDISQADILAIKV